MPVDVARLANDEPTYPAISGRFGIRLISISTPILFDMYSENTNSFSCNTGVELYSSDNIGLICVANKYIIPPMVAKDNIMDRKL